MKLILLFVAYHPSLEEVERLRACLDVLSPEIGYGVIANDFLIGEPIERLESGSSLFVRNNHNLGYGRAINRAVTALASQGRLPAWIGALNTDLAWQPGTMEKLLDWLEHRKEVVLAVPKIINLSNCPKPEQLCKIDPTVLAMLSRRFVPDSIKPGWLRRYDNHYVMADRDLNTVFDVPYLSGCCMLIRSTSMQAVGGFDERFFLYLEDADLTRQLRRIGRCIHLPVGEVCHAWGRGSHRNWRLTLVALHSAWLYFRKWGLRLW